MIGAPVKTSGDKSRLSVKTVHPVLISVENFITQLLI